MILYFLFFDCRKRRASRTSWSSSEWFRISASIPTGRSQSVTLPLKVQRLPGGCGCWKPGEKRRGCDRSVATPASICFWPIKSFFSQKSRPPSRIFWHFLKRELNFTFWEMCMMAQVFPGTLSIYRWNRHLNKDLVKGGMTEVQLTWAGPCESKNYLKWVNFDYHPTWGEHISSPIEWRSALTVQHLRIEVRVVYWKHSTRGSKIFEFFYTTTSKGSIYRVVYWK